MIMKNIAVFLIIIFATILNAIIDLESIESKSQADSLYSIGKKVQKNNELEKALQYLMHVKKYYSEKGHLKELGNTVNRMAGIHGRNYGDWAAAQELWLEALEIKKKLKNKKSIASINNNLAITYDKMAKYSKAEECYQISLDYQKENNDSLKVCVILQNIGLLKLEQEMFFESEKYLSESLDIAESNGYELQSGQIVNNIGFLNFSKGIYSEAFKKYTQALQMLGNEISKYDKAEILNNLGTIYFAYNDTLSARNYYYKALDLCEQVKNKDQKARILNNLGNCYQLKKEYDKGLKYLHESLEIKKVIQNKKGIIVTLLNIGNHYKFIKKYKKAEEYYLEAKEKTQDLGFLFYKAKSEYRLGALKLEEKKFDEALEFLESAISVAEDKLDNFVLSYLIYHKIGEVYYAMEDYANAEENFQYSIENIESIRNGIGLEEQRARFMANVQNVYRSMITLQIKTGNNEKAYDYYEQMKTRNLLDILEGAFLIFDDEMSEEEIEQERELENNLRKINKEITNFSMTELNTRSLDSLVTHLRTVRMKFDQAKSNLIFNHPELRDKIDEGEPITSKDALNLVSKDIEAGLAYLVLEDKIICFVLRNKGRRDKYIKTFEIDITKDDLDKKIISLIQNWKTSDSAFLYNKLITPIISELEGVTRLCIIPDKSLNSLPFHALLNNDKYLIEEYSLFYVNSLSVLHKLRLSSPKGKEKLLAFGNPDFGKEGTLTYKGILKPLPATEDEVISIGEIYKDRAKVFIGATALEKNFDKYAEEYGIIHLATHGLLDELNPMYSAILLTADDNSDGLLTAREILKYELDADLVVLSACETATGKLLEGEGLLGLSRAFFGATVQSIIASLWPVEEQSTKILMELFYQNLNNGMQIVEALRAAQISLMANPRYKHPFFWAPFVLLGDIE
jgi:CHAT domain-containing protein/Tfp pilus assembly protein PilF